MATLKGARVRHRIAEMNWDLAKAGEVSGINAGTLKNATREEDPQPIRLRRAYGLLDALNQPGFGPLKIGDIVADFGTDGVPDDLVGEKGDGTPDEPPDQAPQGPTKPPPQRKEKAGGGPKRPGGNAQRGAA